MPKRDIGDYDTREERAMDLAEPTLVEPVAPMPRPTPPARSRITPPRTLNHIVVVNLTRAPEYDVYCGRTGFGRRATFPEYGEGYFGNPYSAGKFGRADAIRRFVHLFESHLKSHLGPGDLFVERLIRLLWHTPTHRPGVLCLGCFCRPASCHCDCYAEFLNDVPVDQRVWLANDAPRLSDFVDLTGTVRGR